MKKVSDIFNSIKFASVSRVDDTKHKGGSTDDEEHYAVGEKEYAQQLQHAKKRAGQEVKEEHLEEKNVPTSPEKWAQAKAQAKAKFDVYPSAYANGWAAKKYKEMGGGWKSVSEETSWSKTGKEATHRETGERTYEYHQVDKEGKPTGKREYRNAQGKSMGESVEQIDELSKDTLKSYRLKSIGRASDFENKGYAAAKGSAGNDKSDKLFNKADAVSKARKRAQEKLREDEQIEEEIAGWIAHYNGQKHEIKKHEAKDLYDAKQKAIAHFKAPKSKHGLIAVKPAYNESVELEEGQMKRMATDKEEDERLKSKSWKAETPWMKSKETVTDKSGAKHTAMSRARDLARQAAKKQSEYAKARKAGSSTKNAQARAAGANNPHMFESRQLEIVKEAMRSAKKKKETKTSDDTFQAEPELTSQIVKSNQS